MPEEKPVPVPYRSRFFCGNTAQRASGDFARHLLANFPSEPVSYLPACILRAYFPRYFGKILENPQRIFSVFPFISQKIRRRNLHTSDTKQTLIFHKNAREYIQYSLRFLFHLTKNLTTHLSHNLCAVLSCFLCGGMVLYKLSLAISPKVCYTIITVRLKSQKRRNSI